MTVIQLRPAQATRTSVELHEQVEPASPVLDLLDKAVRYRDASRREGTLTPAGRRHRASAEAYLDSATVVAGKPEAYEELHRLLLSGWLEARSLESALDHYGNMIS